MMKCVVAGKGVVEQAVPTLTKAHDVLIKVKAFGINGPDVFQNKGQYPPPPGVTDILGLELSGVVVDAKDQALINKEVVTLVPGGAYAEFCVADARMLLDLPFPKTDKERFIKSAGIPENLFTVWKNTFSKPELRNKKSMLFHGGSGGIGLTATKLARVLGIEKIIVTAGSQEKCDQCLKEGAHYALNYKDTEKPWDEEVKNLGKVDVIQDIVGGSYAAKNLSVLNPGGTLICLGFMGGLVAKELNLGSILMKNLTITGSVLRSNPIEQKIKLKEEIEKELWPKIQSGELKLPGCISKVFKGIEKGAEALDYVTNGHHFGKVIVEL